MIQVSPEHAAKLEKAALEQGVSVEQLLREAIDAFLRQPVRRNAKGFRVPSFVGAFESNDPSWVEHHEELLWAEAHGNHR
jgi:hypothetical protein